MVTTSSSDSTYKAIIVLNTFENGKSLWGVCKLPRFALRLSEPGRRVWKASLTAVERSVVLLASVENDCNSLPRSRRELPSFPGSSLQSTHDEARYFTGVSR